MGDRGGKFIIFTGPQKLHIQAAKWAFEEHLLIKNYEEARNYALLCLNAYRKYKVSLAD